MALGLLAHFGQCARHNRQANDRLYVACGQLSDAQRRQDLGAFFGSIHATLNHILLGDRIWLTRFTGGSVPSSGLDAILHDDFEILRQDRQAQDRAIEDFFRSIDLDFLDGSIAYVNNERRPFNDPVTVLVPHLFNHQTHHRGQVHAMITRFDRALAPVLDMHRVLIPDALPDS